MDEAPQEKIISIATRKPITIVSEEEKIEAQEKEFEALRQKDIDETLKAIDEFRAQVAKGDVTGVILIGRHLPTGLFITDCEPLLSYQPEANPALAAMTYAGQLDMIRLSLLSYAESGPVLVLNEEGKFHVHDPAADFEPYEEDEDEGAE